jgi:hypothetical protein
MPWKETSPVEERLRFVAGLLEGEPRRRCAINAAYVARPATRAGVHSTCSLDLSTAYDTGLRLAARVRVAKRNYVFVHELTI